MKRQTITRTAYMLWISTPQTLPCRSSQDSSFLQLVSQNPRWHLVDIAAMSESTLAAEHLRDDLHPDTDFLKQVMNIYLNLFLENKIESRQKIHSGSMFLMEKLKAWEEDYAKHEHEIQADNLREAEAAEARCACRTISQTRRPPPSCHE